MDFFSDTAAILDSIVLIKTLWNAQGGKCTPVGIPKDLSQNNSIQDSLLSVKSSIKGNKKQTQDILVITFNNSI